MVVLSIPWVVMLISGVVQGGSTWGRGLGLELKLQLGLKMVKDEGRYKKVTKKKKSNLRLIHPDRRDRGHPDRRDRGGVAVAV